MKPKIQEFQNMFLKRAIPAFGPGDSLRVSFRVREGDKERMQAFEGVVLQIKGASTNRTVTLRKVSGNVAVERIFPLHSPAVAEVTRIRRGRVRRAKLYYLRGLQGKAARIREEKRAPREPATVKTPSPAKAEAKPEAAPKPKPETKPTRAADKAEAPAQSAAKPEESKGQSQKPEEGKSK